MSQMELYTRWAEKLSYSGSELLFRLLQALATPEECRILVELPASPEELAKRLKLSEEAMGNSLQQLTQRGLVIPTRHHGFLTPTSLLQLEDATMSSSEEYINPEIYDLWRELYEAEWGKVLADFFDKRQRSHIRVIPAAKALQKSRGISPGDILPYEDVKEIARRAKTIAVVNCPCRRIHRECDEPREVCIQYDRAAEYAIRRKAGRELSVEGALALIDYAEECGLIHTVPNSTAVYNLLCNCCADCCVIIGTAIRYGVLLRPGGVDKSRFQATFDLEACTGCQDCVERCPFGAIEMAKPASSKKLKAALNQEKCFGCGQCVLACEHGAISLKLVRPVEYIPQPEEGTFVPTFIPRSGKGVK